jgi:type I restriction enzyme, R subunit
VNHFAFLDTEWPELLVEAKKAEMLAHSDPRTSCFYARRTLELAINWLYRGDPSLKLPYADSLSSLIHAPEFRKLVDQALLTKAKLIKDLGNRAVHSMKRIDTQDAVTAVRELFHFNLLARPHLCPPGAAGVRPRIPARSFAQNHRHSDADARSAPGP